MVPEPTRGRVYRARRRVRLGDAAPSRRLRLDACLRYLQDVGNDDTEDSGLDDALGPAAGMWVVRRAVVDVLEPARWNEWLDLTTWCSGTGAGWAERRMSMTGERGGRVEVETLWVHLDSTTFMPTRLPEVFTQIYGEAAGGRRVSAKRQLPGPPVDGDHLERQPWPLRLADYDVMNHVNNAAYWAAVEEIGVPEPPFRASLEYGAGITAGAAVELLFRRDDKQVDLWFDVAGSMLAKAQVTRL
jgi:acyl-ACP thioesterase